MTGWLHVTRGAAPLIVSIPHAGTVIPDELLPRLNGSWLAKRDADWWVDRLYGFAASMGATLIRTDISRTVIDMNRDPSGASLYPGQATTGLCPVDTFDGDPLWRDGHAPDAAEVEHRRTAYFDPYHAAVRAEIDRLRAVHPAVVLYDAHSIRSHVSRLFEGELPVFNIGTDGGRTCTPALQSAVEQACAATGLSMVSNGRFRGGWITRHYGAPDRGVHAVQMELAMRGYLREPKGASTPDNWPVTYEEDFAEPMRAHLRGVLEACLNFASSPIATSPPVRPD